MEVAFGAESDPGRLMQVPSRDPTGDVGNFHYNSEAPMTTRNRYDRQQEQALSSHPRLPPDLTY
jgi:hypothetical protein